MPKIVDHDARRREIITVARRLIVEGGFRAATMRSLAAEAGYANGALKHYFESKEDIVEATFETILDEIDSMEAFQLGSSLSAIDRLHFTLMSPLPSDPKAFADGRVLLALADHALDSPRLRARYQRHLEQWRGAILRAMEAARDEGSVRDDVDFGMIADAYMSMVTGSAVMHLMYPNGEKVPVYEQFVTDTMAMLTTRTAAAPEPGPEPATEDFTLVSLPRTEQPEDSAPVRRHDVVFSNGWAAGA